ncbi:MAG: TrkA family potassium uptake protein [Lachnospiraceae bacterium]|nr:TrkA family potassium uptake protein [Lachnospiraceae bacterium]
MKKSFAVIGLGRFGRSIAMELSKLGADVMVIDKDDEKINRLSDYVTCAMNIDVCDTDALSNAGISNMDAVIVAMADYLEPSIMSVITAKDLGVPLVIAKARDHITGGIYDKVGADKVVFPERESGKRVSRQLMCSDFLEFFELSDTVSLIELMPKKEWVGKTLRELNLRRDYKINVIAVKEDDDVNVVMDPDEPLKANCPLIITVKKVDMKRLM